MIIAPRWRSDTTHRGPSAFEIASLTRTRRRRGRVARQIAGGSASPGGARIAPHAPTRCHVALEEESIATRENMAIAGACGANRQRHANRVLDRCRCGRFAHQNTAPPPWDVGQIVAELDRPRQAQAALAAPLWAERAALCSSRQRHGSDTEPTRSAQGQLGPEPPARPDPLPSTKLTVLQGPG